MVQPGVEALGYVKRTMPEEDEERRVERLVDAPVWVTIGREREEVGTVEPTMSSLEGAGAADTACDVEALRSPGLGLEVEFELEAAGFGLFSVLDFLRAGAEGSGDLRFRSSTIAAIVRCVIARKGNNSSHRK